MKSVVLDSTTIEKLTSFNGDRIELRDEAGKLRGWCKTEPTLTLEEMEACFTPEELAYVRDPNEPTVPMEEVLRRIGITV